MVLSHAAPRRSMVHAHSQGGAAAVAPLPSTAGPALAGTLQSSSSQRGALFKGVSRCKHKQAESKLPSWEARPRCRLVDQLEALTPAVPSLAKCTSLTVKGPVRFEEGVVVEGDVTLANGGCAPLPVPRCPPAVPAARCVGSPAPSGCLRGAGELAFKSFERCPALSPRSQQSSG